MKNKIFLTTIASIIAGCGAGSSSGSEPVTPAQRIEALERSGSIPKLDRSNTLLGPDVNSNGVRDDIDAYLAANYTSSEQLSAATQAAKAMQNTLKVDPTDLPAVRLVERQNSRAINCLYSTFEGGNISKEPARVGTEIESMTSNTKQRLLAYLKYNKALDGTHSSMPDGDTCEHFRPG